MRFMNTYCDFTGPRLGPEVLLSGKYGPENDVFLLVTVFWETMRIMELSASDPAATDAHFAPFADILRTQVRRSRINNSVVQEYRMYENDVRWSPYG